MTHHLSGEVGEAEDVFEGDNRCGRRKADVVGNVSKEIIIHLVGIAGRKAVAVTVENTRVVFVSVGLGERDSLEAGLFRMGGPALIS